MLPYPLEPITAYLSERVTLEAKRAVWSSPLYLWYQSGEQVRFWKISLKFPSSQRSISISSDSSAKNHKREFINCEEIGIKEEFTLSGKNRFTMNILGVVHEFFVRHHVGAEEQVRDIKTCFDQQNPQRRDHRRKNKSHGEM